jgi:hypothetical protein
MWRVSVVRRAGAVWILAEMVALKMMMMMKQRLLQVSSLLASLSLLFYRLTFSSAVVEVVFEGLRILQHQKVVLF